MGDKPTFSRYPNPSPLGEGGLVYNVKQKILWWLTYAEQHFRQQFSFKLFPTRIASPNQKISGGYKLLKIDVFHSVLPIQRV